MAAHGYDGHCHARGQLGVVRQWLSTRKEYAQLLENFFLLLPFVLIGEPLKRGGDQHLGPALFEHAIFIGAVDRSAVRLKQRLGLARLVLIQWEELLAATAFERHLTVAGVR